MPTFWIKGLDKQTGDERQLEVGAESSEAAINFASMQDIVVETCSQLKNNEPNHLKQLAAQTNSATYSIATTTEVRSMAETLQRVGTTARAAGIFAMLLVGVGWFCHSMAIMHDYHGRHIQESQGISTPVSYKLKTFQPYLDIFALMIPYGTGFAVSVMVMAVGAIGRAFGTFLFHIAEVRKLEDKVRSKE